MVCFLFSLVLFNLDRNLTRWIVFKWGTLPLVQHIVSACPLFFISCFWLPNCVVKFADDTMIVSLLQGVEQGNSALVNVLYLYHDASHSFLMLTKQRTGLLISRTPLQPALTVIQGSEISKLQMSWDSYLKQTVLNHVDFVFMKDQQHLYFLRKVNS